MQKYKLDSPPSVALSTPLVYFVTVLLIPPQSPLSEVYATVTLFSTSAPALCLTSDTTQCMRYMHALAVRPGLVVVVRVGVDVLHPDLGDLLNSYTMVQ